MSIRPSIDQQTIRHRCELIRSRWDAKTTAERRATAIVWQRELAQQLGISVKSTDRSDVRHGPLMVGAA